MEGNAPTTPAFQINHPLPLFRFHVPRWQRLLSILRHGDGIHLFALLQFLRRRQTHARRLRHGVHGSAQVSAQRWRLLQHLWSRRARGAARQLPVAWRKKMRQERRTRHSSRLQARRPQLPRLKSRQAFPRGRRLRRIGFAHSVPFQPSKRAPPPIPHSKRRRLSRRIGSLLQSHSNDRRIPPRKPSGRTFR